MKLKYSRILVWLFGMRMYLLCHFHMNVIQPTLLPSRPKFNLSSVAIKCQSRSIPTRSIRNAIKWARPNTIVVILASRWSIGIVVSSADCRLVRWVGQACQIIGIDIAKSENKIVSILNSFSFVLCFIRFQSNLSAQQPPRSVVQR